MVCQASPGSKTSRATRGLAGSGEAAPSARAASNPGASAPTRRPRPSASRAIRPSAKSYASSATYWLFPGGIPGNHLATENIRSQLVARGIQPAEARKAAMFGLAAEIPTPILADILGLGTNTAVRWAALASRNWGHYAALRRLQQRE